MIGPKRKRKKDKKNKKKRKTIDEKNGENDDENK